MNNTKYTSSQLRDIIPLMLGDGKGVTVNTCGFDSDLCELDMNVEITILSANESDGVIDVSFEQHFPGDDSMDNMDAWTWKYQTVQEVELFETYLKR